MFTMQRALDKVDKVIAFIREKAKEGVCYREGIIKAWRQTMLERADNAHREIDELINDERSDDDVEVLEDNLCAGSMGTNDDEADSTEGPNCLRFVDEEASLEEWRDRHEEDLRKKSCNLKEFGTTPIAPGEATHGADHGSLQTNQPHARAGADVGQTPTERWTCRRNTSVLSHLQEIKIRNRDVSDAYKVFVMSPHSTLRRTVVEEHKTTARHALETAWFTYKAIYDRTQGIHDFETSTPKTPRVSERDLLG
ncbi:unnamed protein product [Sphagnum tenellum]